MAPRLSHSESAVINGAIASMTLAATKAPTAMKAPWPKLSTSIRPKVSVSPDAMMKIISPMARPATVSVTQLVGEPISGSASAATTGISSSGTQSRVMAPASLMFSHAEAKQVLLEGRVGGEGRHGAAMRDLAVVHDRDAVAELAGEGGVLLGPPQAPRAVLPPPEGVGHCCGDCRPPAPRSH